MVNWSIGLDVEPDKVEESSTYSRREPDTKFGRYSLVDLPANGCKWPYGESGYLFCGDARDEDHHAYCPYHVDRGTTALRR